MKKTVFYLMLLVFILTGTMMTNARKTKVLPGVEKTQSDYYRMTGSIGQYPIVMYLDPFSARKGSTCGYYYYRSKPSSKFNLVAKAVKRSGNTVELTLYEYPSGTKTSTGSFVGKAKPSSYYDGCSFSGTFYNSKGKSYHFNVAD